MGATQKFSALGAWRLTRKRCQPSSNEELWAGQRSGESEISRARGSDKEAVGLRGSQEIDYGLETEQERPAEGRSQREGEVAADFTSLRRWAEEKMFGDLEARRIRRIGGEFGQILFEDEHGVVGRRISHLKSARSDTGQFVELQGFVIRRSAPGIEEQKAERVASEAIIAQESLEVGLLHADLIVDGDGATLRSGGRGGFAKACVISLADGA